jgi:hypothetical protein
MPGGLAAVVAELDRRLTAATPPAARSRLTAAGLRHLAVEYLRYHDELVVWERDLARRPHWNLWASDAQESAAVFAVLVFRPDGVEFFCGTGAVADVHRLFETRSPVPASDVYATLRDHFPISEPALRLDRPTAEAWLDRPRPW